MSTDAPDVRELNNAYRHCLLIARQHYENFPVASRWLPRKLRAPVSVIYAFARTADDIADEGNLDINARIEKLDECDRLLRMLANQDIPRDPIYIALADVIRKHEVPLQLFHDLVSAFRQDVTTTRYMDFASVLDYCRRSANPVGRLLLHLVGKASEENCQLSDNICTALQLVNFYQDIVQDYTENDRIYLPLEEMQVAGVSEYHISSQLNDPAIREFMRGQYTRTASLLCSGLPLTHRLGIRLNLEIRATLYGGLRILERLADGTNVFSRPRLNRVDWSLIILRTLFYSRACSQFPS